MNEYVGFDASKEETSYCVMDYSGRISKYGDSLLTIVRKAHPLKDWARRIGKRSSHKKAAV